MKKKVLIVIVVVVVGLVLFYPQVLHLEDGGSVEYRALVYQVTKVHSLSLNHECIYNEGLMIEIFGKEIFNNVKCVKADIHKYTKTIDNVTINFNMPSDWSYEELTAEKESDYKFALKLSKNESKSMVLYYNWKQFGVCGTGLTTKELVLNGGIKATIGYYNSDDKWSYIVFLNEPNITFTNKGLEYDEALEILASIKIINIE